MLGVLTLYHAERDAFTKDHLRILLAISSKIALSIENALRFQQAESSATTDYLTGLPNARSLFLQLDASCRAAAAANQPLAVLVLRPGRLQAVNDRFGHLEGNRVLRGWRRAQDGVPRVRLRGAHGRRRIRGAAAGSASRPMWRRRSRNSAKWWRRCAAICSTKSLLTISIGVAHFPIDGTDAEQLLAEADRRMYKEKHSHKPSVMAVGTVLQDTEWVTTVH